jgi:hypothetical protein
MRLQSWLARNLSRATVPPVIRRRGDEAGVVGDDDGMHPVAGASFGQDPADVGLDGGFGRE